MATVTAPMISSTWALIVPRAGRGRALLPRPPSPRDSLLRRDSVLCQTFPNYNLTTSELVSTCAKQAEWKRYQGPRDKLRSIPPARYRRKLASHGALIARLQSAPAKPQCRAVLRKKRPLSLGQTRAWTTPVNRCFLKKWRLGRCNFEQNTVIKSALRGDWCIVQRATVLSRRVLGLPRACASIRSGNAAPTTS